MRWQLPGAARLFIWSSAVSAAALFLWWLHAWQGPGLAQVLTGPGRLPLLAILLALSVITYHVTLQVAPGHDVDVTEAMHFALLLLFGAAAGMALVALATLAGEVTLVARQRLFEGRRLRVHQIIFNTAQGTLATGLGGLVYYAFVPHDAPAPLDRLENLWAAPAAAGTIYLAMTWQVAIVIGLQRRCRPIDLWLLNRRREALQEAGLFLLGFITARTAAHDVWMPLVMLLPAIIIYVSLKRTVQLIGQTIAAVEALADVVDRRDRYTFEHSKRVAAYAEAIARAMGLPGHEVETIRLAARVHDLGKMGVPNHVLHKPGKLSAEEWELMRQHPQIGYEILSRFPEYRLGRELVLMHHERYDGQGYPNGLSGQSLRLGAQIIAMADAWDAMTTDRPYRRALSLEQALAEVRAGRGTQWSPQVVDALEQVVRTGRVSVPAAPAVA
jgi:putative nucleotidyltransferase with HDIG domain